MAYIICEPCVGTKDTACVDVCPVDCIHPRKDEPAFQTAEMLYIHPDECIDCRARVPRRGHLRARRNAAEMGDVHPEKRGLLWDSLTTGSRTTSSRPASTACSTGRANRRSGRWGSGWRAARSR